MKSISPSYRRLPGRGLNWSGNARLWIADDHLLQVNSTLLAERYRRFFLKDIRAILVRPTKVRLIWTIVHAAIILVAAASAGALVWFSIDIAQEELRVTLLVFAGMIGFVAVPILPLFIVNVLLGPSCACHVETSAGLERLTAPTRTRGAQRLLAQLVPIIEAAQSTPAAPR